MYTNVRLDTTDRNKVEEAFKKYADLHLGIKYLLASEEGTKTGKPHYQGWCYHTAKRTAFSQYINSSFPELKGGKRSITRTINLEHEYTYICKNKTKPDYKFENNVTNYTEDEVHELVKDLPQFVSKEEHFQNKSKHPQSWWHDTIDILDQKCVYNGTILYSTIPTVFFNLPMPKRLSKTIIKENLQGMIMELERRHHGNTRLRDDYMESISHDPLFKHSKDEFELFKKLKS